MIVVLDSGVWISALQFGGAPLQVLAKALAVDQLAYCEEIRSEVEQIMSEKFDWERKRIQTSLSSYLRNAIRVPVRGTVQGICRDPKDDMVLECAERAAAQIIVTGDKDLLVVEVYQGIRVLNPRRYLELPFRPSDLTSSSE